MEDVVKNLLLFQFSRIEAETYLCLLQNKEMNGSQVAKNLNKPRTSVYMALENLYKKGAVFMLPGDPVYYRPQNPKVLIENLKNIYSNSFATLEKDLEDFNIYSSDDQFWNLKGFNNIILKTKEILNSAEKEIFINTNLDLQIFYHEIKTLIEKKVRIITFSFHNPNLENLNFEFYYNPRRVIENPFHRLMVVVDEKKVLVASGNEMGEYLATFSDNFFLVSIILEHIHNDIYLKKLDQKYGNHLSDQDILIHSIFEDKVTSAEK